MSRAGKILSAALATLVVASACTSIPRIPTAAQRDAVYARAKTWFADAVLIKPRSSTNSSEAFALAPLFVCEIGGLVAVAPKVVWFSAGEVKIAGTTVRQMTYLWDSTPDSRQRGLSITLNADGSPCIWEIFDRAAPCRQIIVSQSLETAARQASGAALRGRRFAVEADVASAPAVVVARVIEDGPAAMGPMVLADAQGRVVTLFCRCMPTPSRTVSGEGNFELRPLPQRLGTTPVDSVLRLPKNFFRGAAAKGG